MRRTPDASALRLAFWPCYTLGDRTFIFIHTSTASCRAAASGRTAQAGLVAGSNRSFSPFKYWAVRFRNVFLTYLRKAFREGKLRFHGEMAALAKPAAFEALRRRAQRKKWVVHSKPPFGGPQQVLKYLARYTHRVAISNSRIVSIEGGRVTFLWKDYAGGSQTRVMTLNAVEFIRRFLLHILPTGLVRIRQFGFLANRARGNKLALCRALLGAQAATPRHAVEPRVRRPCPVCKTGHLIPVASVAPAPLPRQDSS